MRSNMRLNPKPLLLFPLFFLLLACGSQKPMVEDIKVAPHYVDTDLYVSLSANLSIGNVTLPQASFPIFAPKTFEEIGSVAMSSLLGGKNLLEVNLNMSAIANVEAQTGRLPNGSVLPLIGNNRTIVIPIAKKVELYVSLDDGTAVMGVSIPFKTLDGLGAKVGTASLFPMFNINQIVGAGGLYTSKSPGQNGFGLFADVSSALEPLMFADLGFRGDIQTQQELNYHSISPSSRKEKRIDREMYYLHRKRARLSLH